MTHDDAYEVDFVVTLRPDAFKQPEPLFCCAICLENIAAPRWHPEDGRSRNIAPICTHCEQSYGGCNLSSWHGAHRMDARIARRIKAAAVYLSCLVARKKQGW
jgi:hypothetical protein